MFCLLDFSEVNHKILFLHSMFFPFPFTMLWLVASTIVILHVMGGLFLLVGLKLDVNLPLMCLLTMFSC